MLKNWGEHLGKPVFLLGAGASIDAGLFDTNRLTREVYGILRKDHYKVPAQVFGYVIAKILARKIRKDGSPFDDVNVEEAYDGVERLVYRDRDLTSEFVSSWDPFLDSLRPAFDKDRFARKIKDSFQFLDGRYMSGTPTFNIDSSRLKDAADEIGRAMVTSTFAGQSNILPYLTNALLRTLQHDAAKIQYMSEILQIAILLAVL